MNVLFSKMLLHKLTSVKKFVATVTDWDESNKDVKYLADEESDGYWNSETQSTSAEQTGKFLHSKKFRFTKRYKKKCVP